MGAPQASFQKPPRTHYSHVTAAKGKFVPELVPVPTYIFLVLKPGVQTWNHTRGCSVEGAFTESTSSENQTSFSTRVVESPGQEICGNGGQKCSSVLGNAVGSASSITFPLRAWGDWETVPQLWPLGLAVPGLPQEAGGRLAWT